MPAMWTTQEDEETFEGTVVKCEFLGMPEMPWRCVWICNSFKTGTGKMSSMFQLKVDWSF